MGYECGGFVLKDEANWDALNSVLSSYRVYRWRNERVWVIDPYGPVDYPFANLIGAGFSPELTQSAEPIAQVLEVLHKHECEISDGGAVTALRIAKAVGMPVLSFEGNDEDVNAASVCDASGIRRIRSQAECLDVLFDGSSVQITPLEAHEPDWPKRWRRLRKSLESLPAVTITEPKPYNPLMHWIAIAEVQSFLNRQGPFLNLGGEAEVLDVELVFEWNWIERPKPLPPPAPSQTDLRALLEKAAFPKESTSSRDLDDFQRAVQAYDLAMRGVEEQLAKGFVYLACRNMGDAADALAAAGAVLWKCSGACPRPWLEEGLRLLARIQEHNAAFTLNNRIFLAPFFAHARIWTFLLDQPVQPAWVDAANFPMRHIAELQPRFLGDAADSFISDLLCQGTLPQEWSSFRAVVNEAQEGGWFTAGQKRRLLARLNRFEETNGAIAHANWTRFAQLIRAIADDRERLQERAGITPRYAAAVLIQHAGKMGAGPSAMEIEGVLRWHW